MVLAIQNSDDVDLSAYKSITTIIRPFKIEGLFGEFYSKKKSGAILKNLFCLSFSDMGPNI